MPLKDYQRSLKEIDPLIEMVRVGVTAPAALKGAGLDVGVIPAATSSAVVLMVGRFEEFLKQIAEHALAQYPSASPPLSRSALELDLQIQIVRANLIAATKVRVHGVSRAPMDQLSEMHKVSARVTGDDVWGDNAISTESNPSPETVTSILKMIGLPSPWKVIKTEFAKAWSRAQSLDRTLKAIPDPSAELRSILVWRNTVAHSANSLPIGVPELVAASAFFGALASSINAVTRRRTQALVRTAGSAPARWS